MTTTTKRPDGGELSIGQTNRGFAFGKFEDRYGLECSLQKSSLATEDCIWLGAHEKRMHLTQEMVAMLLPALTAFAETGDLVRTPTNESPASQAEASEHAPWSEDEEDAERLLACASRRKKYGDENCECDEDGSCVECEYDMQDALKKRYAPPKHTITPTNESPAPQAPQFLPCEDGEFNGPAFAGECCSAISPCAHQRKSPDTICETCRLATARPAPQPPVEGLREALEPWRDELTEIIGHLGAAIIQSTASDDQIIMDHVKAAHEIAKIVRRKA